MSKRLTLNGRDGATVGLALCDRIEVSSRRWRDARDLSSIAYFRREALSAADLAKGLELDGFIHGVKLPGELVADGN